MNNSYSFTDYICYLRRILLLVLLAPFLSACGYSKFELFTAGVAATANGIFDSPKVNLREKDAAAADYLLQQSGNYINREDIIAAKPLYEADHAGVSSPLGRKISSDIALRLSELGYNLDLHEVASPSDKAISSVGAAYPQYILSGTYLIIRKKRKVAVSLRISDAGSGKMISAFDYTMPLTGEIDRLSRGETRIFRINKK